MIVRVGSGAPVATLRGFGRFKVADVSAAFSPDGSRVVTRRGNTLRLWDAAGGEELARLGRAREETPPATASATTAGWSSSPSTIGPRRSTRRTARRRVRSNGDFAAISNDGAFAAALGNDGSVEVVELATKLGVAVQTDTASPLDSISFGPDPGLLVGADQQGDVHILRCAICAAEDELLARARARRSRSCRASGRTDRD